MTIVGDDVRSLSVWKRLSFRYLYRVLALFLICVLISVLAHFAIRDYWSAVSVAAVTTSLANMFHEAYITGFQIRPVDAIFWGPATIAFVTFLAFPIAAIVGCPFYLVRRNSRKISN